MKNKSHRLRYLLPVFMVTINFCFLGFSFAQSEDKLGVFAADSFKAAPEVIAPEYAKYNLISQLKKTKQELANTRETLSSLKEAYLKKQEQCADLQARLNRFKQDFDALEALTERINKEKEFLQIQQSKLSSAIEQVKSKNEQEVSLLRAQLEQVRAEKEGEFLRLNAKIAEMKSQKDLEAKSLNDKISQTQGELKVAQDLSFQSFQEKTSLLSQQKQLNAQQDELKQQIAMLEQRNKKLEEQNEFLKSQYVGISQEASQAKEQNQKILKEKSEVASLNQKISQLELSKKELQQKLLDYEDKFKEKEALEREYKLIYQQLADLKKSTGQGTLEPPIVSPTPQEPAVQPAKTAKTAKEDSVTMHYNMGVLYAQSQEYKKAVMELEKVIKMKPDDAESYYNLGVIYGEYLNNRKKAISYFKKFLALAPNDTEVERVKRYILTWDTYEQEIR